MNGVADKDDSIKFSAVVVTFNEERYLKESLKSLSFCDQLIVVDLGSTDSSVRIAEAAGAEVLRHKRVPVVEQVREFALKHTRNKWVIFHDPDEVMPEGLEAQLRDAINKNPDAAIIRAPWKFYFKEKPLDCCIWGAEDSTKITAIHKDRVAFRPLVHRGYEVAAGYVQASIPRKDNNSIRHYWMHSYGQLFEKHLRYIKQEGESRYKAGERFSWVFLLRNFRQALMINLFYFKGIRGGFRGVSLSFFYGWYVFMSILSLRKYEREIKKGIPSVPKN